MSQAQEWSARVQLPVALSQDQADDVAEALVDQGASVLVQQQPDRSAVSFTVDAADLAAAVQQAMQLAAAALPEGINPVGIEVITGHEQERRLGLLEPGPSGAVDLVDTTEVGAILGVSRQRVERMVRDVPDFPRPVTSVGQSRRRVWPRRVIEDYARTREAHPRRGAHNRSEAPGQQAKAGR